MRRSSLSTVISFFPPYDDIRLWKYEVEVIRLNGKEVLRESRADTCDSREIRRTTPRESPRTSRCLRLRATFPSGTANRCASRPTMTALSPTWRYRLRRALSLHTGCARNNFPDSLFSLISCEIQYPKFSTTGVWKRDLSLILLLLSSLLPFVRNFVRFKIAPRLGRDAKRERYRCFPMGRQNSAPCNRGINRYWRCRALHLRPGKTFPVRYSTLYR